MFTGYVLGTVSLCFSSSTFDSVAASPAYASVVVVLLVLVASSGGLMVFAVSAAGVTASYPSVS